MRKCFLYAPWMGLMLGLAGCHSPSVTAVSLNADPCGPECGSFWGVMHHCLKQKEEGIPFYLPKPLLVISKNFRNIEESKVGLTDTAPIPNYFDDQSKYADLNARTNFAGLDGNPGFAPGTGTPASQTFPDKDATNLASKSVPQVHSGGAPVSPGNAPSDGIKPETFYTYHIIFVPDLTQKYGLKVTGGAGEIRAAMNLVNGWQFTGLGPYYMKDSSTAQNTLAGGITANLAASGVADVVKAVAQLKPGVTGAGQTTSELQPQTPNDTVEQVKALADAMRQLNPRFLTIPAFAEISIYEPFISPEGTMEWKLIAEQSYSRDVMATDPVSAQAVRNLLKPLATTSTLRGLQPAAFEPALAPPNAIAQLPLLLPLPPKPAAPTSPIAPPSMNLSPMPQIPAASRVPPVQVPRTTLSPGTALRRSSIRSEERGDPKADEEVVRTQGLAVPPPNPAVVASALAQAGQVTLSLSDRDTFKSKTNANATSNPNPIIEVRGVPANATLNLLRDGSPAKTGQVADPNGVARIIDNANQLSPGQYNYQVQLVIRGQSPQLLPGALTVTVQQSSPTVPTDAGVTTVDRQMALSQKMLAQALALRTSATPAALATPAGPVTVPAVPPSSGNQINLNQYFGKTKFAAAPTTAAPAKHFSLFHHKQKRPTIATINTAAVDVQAAAGATLAAAPPSGAAPPGSDRAPQTPTPSNP